MSPRSAGPFAFLGEPRVTYKTPAFQWYAKDWLSDGKRAEMSLAQRGAYLDLLSYQWVNGAIPTAIAVLARVLGVTEAEAASLWTGPLPLCFTRDEDGRAKSERLEAYRLELQAFHTKQSQNGAKGAAARWGGDGNRTAIAPPLSGHRLRDSSSSSTSSSSVEGQKIARSDERGGNPRG